MSKRPSITEKGQATIPKELREKYDLDPGDEVVWIDTVAASLSTHCEPVPTTPTGVDIHTEGDVSTHERTGTVDEVREFGWITGDQQPIHTELDDDGRLVVQGI